MIRLGSPDSRATVMTLLRTRQLPRCSYTFMSSDAVSMATSPLKKIRFHSFSASHILIRTEGALWLPTTYDNHLSQSHPTHPMPQSLFNHLNRPWIDLTRQKGSIIKISWPIELNDLKWSVDLRWFFDPVLHSSLDDHVFKSLMIWRWLLKISPQDFLITSCQFFMIWHSLVKASCKPDNSTYFFLSQCVFGWVQNQI